MFTLYKKYVFFEKKATPFDLYEERIIWRLSDLKKVGDNFDDPYGTFSAWVKS